ncbi:hypothetical protein MASR1M45_08830 [Candidatus Kapaibacterium sp.]
MSSVSITFAVDAEQHIKDGNPKAALELIQKGLEVYPSYPSAIGVLAKAYFALGDIESANSTLAANRLDIPARIYDNVLEFFNTFDPASVSNINLFDESIDEDNILEADKIGDFESEHNIMDNQDEGFDNESDITSDNSIIENSQGDDTFSESHNICENSESLSDISDVGISSEEENVPSPLNKNYDVEEIIKNFEEFKNSLPGYEKFAVRQSILFKGSRLSTRNVNLPEFVNKQSSLLKLIKKIENAGHIKPEPNEKSKEPKKSPVMITDTIAAILAQQGEIQESIKAYKTLAELNPEKSEYYQNKISELKSGNK